jgi:hypothetical protein
MLMDHITCTGIARGMEEQCLLWERELYQATYSYLREVKLNTRSSTKTELVVTDMYMPEMLWLLYFMESKGGKVECIGLHQDNTSTQLLMKNGQFSSKNK